jgi:hypothetical protein
LIKLDLMYTNIKADAHQGCDTFKEGRIRINIVSEDTDTNTSPLVSASNRTNSIACYTFSLLLSPINMKLTQIFRRKSSEQARTHSMEYASLLDKKIRLKVLLIDVLFIVLRRKQIVCETDFGLRFRLWP